MREFTNYLTVKDMKYLDLFDEIPYKYIKIYKTIMRLKLI